MFSTGTEYYRYSYSRGSIDDRYPQPLSVWNIPGNQVSAAFQMIESYRTYFFNDQGMYNLYNDTAFRPVAGYPKQVVPAWQGCVENLESATVTQQPSGVSGLVPSILVLVTSLVVKALYV